MTRWAPSEIVQAALTAKRDAVERLITAIWPGCFRLAASVLGDVTLAQDAAQEACLVVYRKIGTLRRPEAFDAWLFRIVMRESTRMRRRFARPVVPTFQLGLQANSSEAGDVWAALAKLSTELRAVVVLFYLDDLKTEQIASILDIPHATVRTRLMRARVKLRGLLAEDRDISGLPRKEESQYVV